MLRSIRTASASALAVVVSLLGFFGNALAQQWLHYDVLWRYRAPSGACEIAAYSTATQQLFATVGGGVDVVSVRSGARVGEIAVPAGFHATSVACADDVVAVAWAADDKLKRGRITFYDAANLAEVASNTAGFLPDMITFTPDGKSLLAANEGEPTVDYAFDPEASVSIITAVEGWKKAKSRAVKFTKFNSQRDALITAGVHLYGPSDSDTHGFAIVAQDVEPEYIAVSSDSQTAWITLQENNAIAELNLASGEIVAIYPVGLKNFRALGQADGSQFVSLSSSAGLDASDQDGGPRIRHWPVWGMYQPDGIATFREDSHDFLVTANEGDPRDYFDFHEVVRIGDLATMGIDIDLANPARNLIANELLGQLEISRFAGDSDGDDDLDRFVCLGTRSFAIWEIVDDSLKLIFDSGSDFEQTITQLASERFNADSTADSQPDVRSPIRGPEPENIALFELSGKRIVAIGLERAGGAMLYDISRPHEPVFLDYLPPHESGGLMDLAPEGLLAIPAVHSPNGKPLLILCNEGSGTMTAYELTQDADP
jgi:2',3'-cyclic-nucleotide 2'-phosphodiesterase/3'-nucleotidase/5'-nucleotidase